MFQLGTGKGSRSFFACCSCREAIPARTTAWTIGNRAVFFLSLHSDQNPACANLVGLVLFFRKAGLE